EEAVPAEDLVEQHLRVVRLARIEMDVERAVLPKKAPCLAEAGLEEREGVVEAVGVGRRPEDGRPVAAAAEAGAIAFRSQVWRQPQAALLTPGVERRVEVDQRERLVGEAREQLHVVAQMDRLLEHRGSLEPASDGTALGR